MHLVKHFELLTQFLVQCINLALQITDVFFFNFDLHLQLQVLSRLFKT